MSDHGVQESRPRVSVAFPVYDEQDSLRGLYEEVCEALAASDVDYELVFVDNGSSDGSLAMIKRLREGDANVRWVSLSRNFGHQGGLFAGMQHATGDVVITMDADLQHPPTLIPQMIALWRKGFEVVYTTKRHTDIGLLKRAFMRAFYWLISKLSGLRLEYGQSDFRLLDRRALDAIISIPEYHKFLRGQVSWVGFRQAGLEYDVAPRRSGSSKFSYTRLFAFAFDGVFAFSRYPLHLSTMVGSGVAALALLYMGYVVVVWLVQKLGGLDATTLPPGWATSIAATLFMGSVQLIAIGVLGEYVGRVFDQTKGRPVYIVRETSE